MRPILWFRQHLKAVQEVLHWKFSTQEIKADDVKNQRTVPALQKENCSLNPEETLQKEPIEVEALKISVEAAPVQGLLVTFLWQSEQNTLCTNHQKLLK